MNEGINTNAEKVFIHAPTVSVEDNDIVSGRFVSGLVDAGPLCWQNSMPVSNNNNTCY